MIYIFTGQGKGKTTAAIGQGVRAVGQGRKVLIVQFIKDKKFLSGEEKAIAQFSNRFDFIKGGRGFVDILGDNLPREEHRKAAKAILRKVQKMIFSQKYDLIILDEINVALKLKLISLREVLEIIKKIPEDLDLILTGRGASLKLIQIADLVTDFKEVKHHFKKGIKAQKGIEY